MIIFFHIFKNNLVNYFEINQFLIISTSVLILVQWVNEILLSKKELENKLTYFYKIFFLCFIFNFGFYFIFMKKPHYISYFNSLLSIFITLNVFKDLISFSLKKFEIWK